MNKILIFFTIFMSISTSCFSKENYISTNPSLEGLICVVSADNVSSDQIGPLLMTYGAYMSNDEHVMGAIEDGKSNLFSIEKGTNVVFKGVKAIVQDNKKVMLFVEGMTLDEYNVKFYTVFDTNIWGCTKGTNM